MSSHHPTVLVCFQSVLCLLAALACVLLHLAELAAVTVAAGPRALRLLLKTRAQRFLREHGVEPPAVRQPFDFRSIGASVN